MGDQWVRRFRVTDPQRHSKGFTVYKVTSTIFPKISPEAKTEIVVWKRFSEFQKLHKELRSRHEKLYLKDQFPPFCKPRLFGRFESDVIEERRLAAQALLDFTGNHPPLFTSQSCVKFFERSHKGQNTEVRNDDPVDHSVLPKECDISDTLSQSSSHSTLTDTDSTISVTSFPSQHEELWKAGNDSSTPNGTIVSSSNPPSSSNCLQSVPNIESIPALNDGQREGNLVVGYTVSGGDTSITIGNVTPTNALLGINAETDQQVSASCSEDRKETQHTTSHIPQTPGTHDFDDSMNVGSIPRTEEDLSESSEVMDYITNAGFHLSQAVEHESNSQFESAFASYKAAISCLLSGVQDDPSEDRKSLVQRKASQYLNRAEQIYHNHLDASYTTTTTIPAANDTPLVQIQKAVAVRSWKSLEAPVSDLKLYKVLGVVSTVILALNTCNDIPFIIKVLHKSPCPVDRRTKSIIPCNVPFMCRLHTFMENDRAVFLVLEQARGGRLWDHISPYFEKNENFESSRAAFAKFLSDATLADGKRTSENNNSTSSHASELLAYNLEEGVQVTCSNEEILKPLGNTIPQQSIQLEGEAYGVIPDIVIQKQAPASRDLDLDSIIHIPDVLPTEKPYTKSVVTCVNVDTEDILKNSQKLLESVNNTLSRSEMTTKVFLDSHKLTGGCGLLQEENQGKLQVSQTTNSQLDFQQNSVSLCVREEKVSLMTKDHKRSASRDRKPSVPRRSRSRIQYSCDVSLHLNPEFDVRVELCYLPLLQDMFEGRARALSRSLDREALQRVDPRDDHYTYPCLPIDSVRLWAAQLLLALDALHRWGVVIGDMRPDNLLLGSGLNLVLTYQCQWICVDRTIHSDAIELLYAAPEIGSIQEITTAADWWSFGAILFELMSGETLHSCHPGGFHSYSTLYIPSPVPEEGASLLRQLLRFEAQNRLGAGPHGVAKLKAHSFFRGIEWNKVLLMSASV